MLYFNPAQATSYTSFPHKNLYNQNMLYYLTFQTPSKSENYHTQKENEEITINNKHNCHLLQ